MAKEVKRKTVYKKQTSVVIDEVDRLSAETNKKKILKNKKQEKLVDDLITNFKDKIKTMEDVKQGSSCFFIKKDGKIQESKMSPSIMKSDLGGTIISSFIKKAKEEENEVQLVVQIFFGKGVIAKSDTEAESQQLADEIESKIENNDPTLDEHPLVKDYMMVEIFGKKLLNLNAFEFITSIDKAEKKTYVCISDKRNLEEYIEYPEGHINYFKK